MGSMLLTPSLLRRAAAPGRFPADRPGRPGSARAGVPKDGSARTGHRRSPPRLRRRGRTPARSRRPFAHVGRWHTGGPTTVLAHVGHLIHNTWRRNRRARSGPFTGRQSAPPPSPLGAITAGQQRTGDARRADEERSCFIQSEETWVLLEPEVGCLEASLRSRQPDAIATQCNALGSSRYSLASGGFPHGPVADQWRRRTSPRRSPAHEQATRRRRQRPNRRQYPPSPHARSLEAPDREPRQRDQRSPQRATATMVEVGAWRTHSRLRSQPVDAIGARIPSLLRQRPAILPLKLRNQPPHASQRRPTRLLPVEPVHEPRRRDIRRDLRLCLGLGPPPRGLRRPRSGCPRPSPNPARLPGWPPTPTSYWSSRLRGSPARAWAWGPGSAQLPPRMCSLPCSEPVDRLISAETGWTSRRTQRTAFRSLCGVLPRAGPEESACFPLPT